MEVKAWHPHAGPDEHKTICKPRSPCTVHTHMDKPPPFTAKVWSTRRNLWTVLTHSTTVRNFGPTSKELEQILHLPQWHSSIVGITLGGRIINNRFHHFPEVPLIALKSSQSLREILPRTVTHLSHMLPRKPLGVLCSCRLDRCPSALVLSAWRLVSRMLLKSARPWPESDDYMLSVSRREPKS